MGGGELPGSRPGVDRQQPPDPGTQRPGQRLEGGGRPRPVAQGGQHGARLVLEVVRVLAQHLRAAGERRGDTGAQLVLEGAQEPAGPDPRERRVLVVRVAPRLDLVCDAGGLGLGPAQRDERPHEQPAPARHTGEGPRTGPAGQPQEHLFGLVVAGVPDEHRGGTEALGRVLQRPVASRPRGTLRSRAVPRDAHRPDVDRVQAEVPALLGRRLGDLLRTRLEPMVDDQPGRLDPPLRCLEPHRARERQRVRATAAPDQHDGALRQEGQLGAHRETGRGDRRRGTGHDRPLIDRGRAEPRPAGRRSRRASGASRVRTRRR